MRVLVIEDYEPVRSAVVQTLTENGFAVDSAQDGRDGMWLAKSGEHDVILFDFMLPHITGLEILESMRAATAHTRAVADRAGRSRPANSWTKLRCG